MDDEKQKLGALTDTPVEIQLGTQVFKARLVNFNDISAFMGRVGQQGAENNAATSFDAFRYLLFDIILEPKYSSVEDLSAHIPGTEILKMNEVLEKVGFPLPQTVKDRLSINPTGAQSTPE